VKINSSTRKENKNHACGDCAKLCDRPAGFQLRIMFFQKKTLSQKSTAALEGTFDINEQMQTL
jgi:hypothetical protein